MFTGCRLSTNPNVGIIDHPSGPNGKVNRTVNGKLFYVLGYIGFDGNKTINKGIAEWADADGNFKVPAPFYDSRGQQMDRDGSLQLVAVNPYTVIDNKTGKAVEYTTTKLMVFDGENVSDLIDSFNERTANTSGKANNNAKTAILAQIETLKRQLDDAQPNAKAGIQKKIDKLTAKLEEVPTT